MSKTTIFEWTLAALLHFAPPEHQDRNPWRDPSREAAVERYEGIARTIVERCGEQKGCASLLAALAIGESGLARDADLGPCHREGRWKLRCDSGRAASVWQAQAYGVDADGEPITVARLFADRGLAAWHTLRVARGSLKLCAKLAPEDRLSGLSGRCVAGPGPWRARWALWNTIRNWNPPAASSGA